MTDRWDEAAADLYVKVHADKGLFGTAALEAIAVALRAEREATLEEVFAAQPSTAENPNESAYERGRFDGVMAYGRAIAALRSLKSTPQETGR